MGAVLSFSADIETMCCWAREGCAVQFGMPRSLAVTLRETGGTFYCPKGHALRFGESEIDKMKRKLEAANQRREWAEKNAATARKAEAIARGKLRAQTERVKNGVCPCCNRTFQNLMRHMQTKHPEWNEEPTETPKGPRR